MVKESAFQSEVIKDLKRIFEGCLVLKNDSRYLQGVPDLLLLYKNNWALLEVKPYEKAKRQPNQDYYVEKLNEMSFAAFIYPENKKAVLDALQRSFKASRKSRVPQR